MLMLDYFWLEKDYYNNRYGTRWAASHLEQFFKDARGSNDTRKVSTAICAHVVNPYKVGSTACWRGGQHSMSDIIR